MKCIKSAPSLLFALLFCLPATVFGGGEKIAGPVSAPCGAETTTTVNAPGAKVIICQPPPEIIYNQQAGCTTCGKPQIAHRSLFHRAGTNTGISYFAQPLAMPGMMSFQQSAAPMMVMSVPTISSLQPISTMNFQPATIMQGSFAAPTVSFVPFQSSAVFNATPTINFLPSTSSNACQSSSSFNTSSLTDLIALKLKAQEMESRANTAFATAMKENLAVQQMAISVFSPSSSNNNAKQSSLPGISSAPAGQSEIANQIDQLTQRVDQLTRIVEQLANQATNPKR